MGSEISYFLRVKRLTSYALWKFASYISQEIATVDKFGSSDEDDDDDDDDVPFRTAPSEPPPPPPLPLNIKRPQHRTQIEDAEKDSVRIRSMGDLDVCLFPTYHSYNQEIFLIAFLFFYRVPIARTKKMSW
jgi:hypothetical protein